MNRNYYTVTMQSGHVYFVQADDWNDAATTAEHNAKHIRGIIDTAVSVILGG